jgi:hypothetical protein
LEFLDIFKNLYKQIKENEGRKKQKGRKWELNPRPLHAQRKDKNH